MLYKIRGDFVDEKFSLDIIKNESQKGICKIIECNEYLKKYGLEITNEDVKTIIEKREIALKKSGRLETNFDVVSVLIREFCDSPYISKENFIETINELMEAFYYYKTETKNKISDEGLIKFMRENYDKTANGDVSYLVRNYIRKNEKKLTQWKTFKL